MESECSYYQTFLKDLPYTQPMDVEQNQTVSDLEAHFNAHFNLAVAEKTSKHKEFDFDKLLDQSYDIDADFTEGDNLFDSNYEETVNISELNPDELLLTTLCEEAAERLTPDSVAVSLPSVETAFSKHFYNYAEYSNRDASVPIEGTTCNNLDICETQEISFVNNLDSYCYPNNILNNLDNDKYDTNTNNSAHTRSVSISESMLSDTDIIFEELENGLTYDENDDEYVDYEILDFNHIVEDNFEAAYSNDGSVEDHSKSDNWSCLWQDCGGHFSGQSTLVTHIEKIHVNSFKGDEFSCLWIGCSRCRRPFNARYKLLIHMRVHSGHKPNICNHPGCEKSFSRLENLKIHRRSHTGERPYNCHEPNCGKAFSNSSDRAKHQRTHFNARPYACQVKGCLKRYTDPSSLRKHVKHHAVLPEYNNSSVLTQEVSTSSSSRPKLSIKEHVKPDFLLGGPQGNWAAHRDTLMSVRNKIIQQGRKIWTP